MKSLTNLQESCKNMQFFWDLFGLFNVPNWSQRAVGERSSFLFFNYGLIWLQEFLVSGSLVTWELQVVSASCWKQ